MNTEKRLFKSRINRAHKYGENLVVLSKIISIADDIGINRDEDGKTLWVETAGNYMYITGYTTEKDYVKFKESVDRRFCIDVFDGLIEFDV